MPLKRHQGNPLPFGAQRINEKTVNFSLFSEHASKLTLVLLFPGKSCLEINFDPNVNKTGSVWHMALENFPEDTSVCYGYRLDAPPHIGYAYDYEKILCDPYAKQICSSHLWGKGSDCLYPCESVSSASMGYVPNHQNDFDWENVKKPNIAINDLIIYEMHVRSFTQDPSSKVNYPGTFLGIIEKIDYLKSLGINAVELLPVFEFNETKNPFISREHPDLCNYWGYSPINFFSPMNRYSTRSEPNASITEFKTMVKELHRNGIEVILDVVFNHTEDNDKNIYSLKGIDQTAYYLLDSSGRPTNYSGCGNSISANYPPSTELIRDSLRYWGLEMQVDGFRFDLASVMTRDSDGTPLKKPTVLELISFDPVLSDIKLIAEPWDAAGLYQLGFFPSICPKWSEWNGQYRDIVRQFINGTSELADVFVDKLKGSPDIYPTHSPLNSINFITSHDGFTLKDLVSYKRKNNYTNGENNRDGTDADFSNNFGEEGPSANSEIENIRIKQIKNFQTALMVSRGIPMLSSGDEYGHTANGNNNRWCHDSSLNHFLWDKLQENDDLFQFFRKMINIRKTMKCLTYPYFPKTSEFRKCDQNGNEIEEARFCPLTAICIKDEDCLLYIAFNVSNKTIKAILPKNDKYDTFFEILTSSQLQQQDINDHIKLAAYSSVILKSNLNKRLRPNRL
ncbi:MAG: isoamylase [Victivallaceae bacterium]